jgi:hypothetical protein
MESALRDFHKSYRWRVSPYQNYVSSNHKNKILNQYTYNVFVIWSVPLALTLAELVFLKQSKSSLADKTAILKFASYAVATVYSTEFIKETIRKLEYFNRLFHKAPQIQLQSIRNSDIYKAHLSN